MLYTAPFIAMNPGEGYATTNFLGEDFGTGIGSEKTTELAAAVAGLQASDAATIWSMLWSMAPLQLPMG